MRTKRVKKKGISLVIALIMTTLLLSISLSVGNIILRQLRITYTNTNSQAAFYAADSALECALYWDTHTDGTIEGSFETAIFGTTTTYQSGAGNPVRCGPNTDSPMSFVKITNDPLNNIATTTFDVDYGNTCAHIEIIKNPNRTIISTRGYNTGAKADASGCDLDDAINRRLVERGLVFTH